MFGLTKLCQYIASRNSLVNLCLSTLHDCYYFAIHLSDSWFAQTSCQRIVGYITTKFDYGGTAM